MLMVLFCSTMLTGCGVDFSFGLKDMFASMDKEADQDQRLDDLAIDSGLVMSKSTHDRQIEYVDALDLQAIADGMQIIKLSKHKLMQMLK